MANNIPGRPEDQSHPEENMNDNLLAGDEEFGEDSFISESLAGLAEVNIPSNFLPNVMFRVYEKHHRDKMGVFFILSTALTLLFLSITFFALDVNAYKEQQQLPSFDEAFDAKIELLKGQSEGVVTGVTGIFSATWRFVSGTMGEMSATTIIIMFLSLILMLYLIKKGLSALMGG